MQRFKVTIEYDGTDFVGFQVQPNQRSVQGEIQRALKLMTKGQTVLIHGSGRTDSGVHALGQVIHFDYPLPINTNGMLHALNSITDDSIRILTVEAVESEFHARYHVKSKRYRYRVDLNHFVSPFKRQYVLNHPYRTDIKRMQQAIRVVLGTHDFKSFCSTKTDKTDFVRTITCAEVYYNSDFDELWFEFEGDGFLYNMVRILVGTLLQIGDGLRPVDDVERLLRVQDRNEAGPTAPPQGLYLEHVTYLTSVERQKKTEAYYRDVTASRSKNQSLGNE